MTRPPARLHVELDLELDEDGDLVGGEAHSPLGPSRKFVGRLGLFAVIEGLMATRAALPPATEPPTTQSDI